MRKAILGAASALVLASPAVAADLAVPRYSEVPGHERVVRTQEVRTQEVHTRESSDLRAPDGTARRRGGAAGTRSFRESRGSPTACHCRAASGGGRAASSGRRAAASGG